MSEILLLVKDLQVTYGQTVALDGVNLHLKKGSLTALVGPNGAGKSTLFKAILQLEKSLSGEISLFGQTQNLGQVLADKVAYIPQASQVNWQFPATVFDIVMMGRYPKNKSFWRLPKAQDKVVVEAALRQLQIWDLRQRQITELSGGQRQRVFLARALAQEAEFYLLDEPLAGIDSQTEVLVMGILKQLQEDGKTSLVIHHDLQTLETYFDDMIWFNQKVVAHGRVLDVLTSDHYQTTYQTVSDLGSMRC